MYLILNKIILVLVLGCFLSNTYAQDSDYYQNNDQSESTNKITPSLFLGVGTGINSIGLLGVAVEYPLKKKISLGGELGLGGWGYKARAVISYYPSELGYKSSWRLAYGRALGTEAFDTELTVLPNNATVKVNLDLLPANTVDLIYSYNLNVGKTSKLVFDLGYSATINPEAYKINTPNVNLDEVSLLVMDWMQPGGILLGIKFMFGS